MKGRDIIKAVMLDHGICAEDFFGRVRERGFVESRKDCAVRLRAYGLSIPQIAGLMKRNHTTISYYLDGKLRSRKRLYHEGKWTEQSAVKYLAPEIRDIVCRYAEATDTKPHLVVAEVVAGWALHEEQMRRVG